MTALHYIFAILGLILMADGNSFVVPLVGLAMFTLGVSPVLLSDER